ncbi:trypsin-like peptidase domain-containing protein [Moraxella sp. Tifton1]|uniref:trypsin-like peptidase domain-containing protein n=1 Tax=Moraxella oculi TaxID=2940516 RepID=UPI002013726B|nr:trypsin-like peptidase domain-containing protein [Moraxella sp. Tifton1]MCL1624117.1 trypsin-like peptidase domain-containing protein [Moraxella sp. Tifton1]
MRTFIKSTMLAGIICLASILPSSPVSSLARAMVQVDFADLVEQVSAGVVRISTTRPINDADTYMQAQTLGRYLGEQVNVPTIEHGFGTGFFITKDGYILTNHHVVDGAKTITVTLNDRTEMDAVLVGSDEASDIAVLKVNGQNFPALTMSQRQLRVGEPVLAIGSPFGFDYSASAGIVSAKHRNMTPDAAVPFIQTDVALNPGNSGGPLFNQQGEVVGVNSHIFSETGGYMGLSFSIPIDAVLHIYDQIKRFGKVRRSALGIVVQDVDRNLAEVYGLSRPQGAILTQVSIGSPADMAGLRAGDLILNFNGTPITQAAELLNLLNRTQPNDVFGLTYQRGRQKYLAQGRFAEAPSDVSASGQHQKFGGVKLGLRLKELSPAELRVLAKFGVQGGVIITSVNPVGLAARTGIQVGDVILGLNNHQTLSVDEMAVAVQSLPKKGVVSVQLIRQGMPVIIGMRIE